MTKPSNIKAVETGSGIAWDEWLEILQPHDKLDHTEMAKIAYAQILKQGRSKSPEWWAQGVTIAYEQHIGRRQPGQTCGGNFSVTVSKTLPGAMDEVLALWSERVANETEFNGVKMVIPGKISQSDKWRYWRTKLEDSSLVSVNIQTKPGGEKSMLAINHDKLNDAKDVGKWRGYWKGYI